MWIKFVTIVAAVCLSACTGATLSEVAANQMAARFGTLNAYYLMTWENIATGADPVVINKDPTTMAGITSLTGTESVAIIIHGREGTVNSDFAFTLRETLIRAHRDMAIILVDWSIVAAENYEQIVPRVPYIADDLSTFIVNMAAATKLDLNQLHIIGFDVGAHIAGIASRPTASRARKITALSPAGGDRWDSFSLRLRVTDAQFVETINTDAVGVRRFGLADGIGGLDFFPNGGTRQPGCANADNWCHHNRAWRLFAATVEEDGHLRGQFCETMTQVNNGRCDAGRTATMGTLEIFKSGGTGRYRVNTGRIYPFGL